MPPTQLSPAASLYLSTQGDVSEKQLFLSTIFGLIAKNVLKFDEQAFKRVSSNNSCLSNDEIVFLKLMNLSEPASEHPIDPEHPNWPGHIRRIQSALNDVIHDEVYDFISHNVKHIRREIVFVVALLALFCSGYPSGAMYFILIPPIFFYVWRSNITRKVLVLNIFLIVGVFISREGDGYDLLMYTVPYMAIGIITVSTFLLITELRNYSPTGAEQMDQLNGLKINFEHRAFKDHHYFSKKDLDFDYTRPIVMTEKDAMRVKDKIDSDGIWYLKMKVKMNINLSKLIVEKLNG